MQIQQNKFNMGRAIFLGMLLLGVASIANGESALVKILPSEEMPLPREEISLPGEEIPVPAGEEAVTGEEVVRGPSWPMILGIIVVIFVITGIAAYFLLKKKK